MLDSISDLHKNCVVLVRYFDVSLRRDIAQIRYGEFEVSACFWILLRWNFAQSATVDLKLTLTLQYFATVKYQC